MPKQFNKNSPHDKLIKKVFDNKTFARAFVTDHLPWFLELFADEGEDNDETEASEIEINRVSETFVDDGTLTGTQCDIALEVSAASQQGVKTAGMLIEHKSVPDPEAPLQTLEYVTAYLKRKAAEEPGKQTDPPLAIPVLLYHGKKKWNLSDDFGKTVNDDGGHPVGLKMGIARIDLSEMSKEKLSSNLHLRGVLYAMLYVCNVLDDGPLGEEDLLDDVLSTLLAGGAHPFESTVVGYIMGTGRATKAAVDASLRRIKSERGGEIMESALVEMVEEGEAKGEAKGRAATIAQQLQHKFGSVPPRVQNRLEQAAPEELEAWSVRIFDAKSPEAIFSD